MGYNFKYMIPYEFCPNNPVNYIDLDELNWQLQDSENIKLPDVELLLFAGLLIN